MGKQKIEDRTVVGQLLTWQHHLIWALFVDLALPCASSVYMMSFDELADINATVSKQQFQYFDLDNQLICRNGD